MQATDSSVLTNRIDALESRLAFQEQSIQALSTELFEVRKRLDTADRLNREMARRIKELQEGDSPNSFPADQRPPHY